MTIHVRESHEGTIEAGSFPADMVRIELPDRHLWLYADENNNRKVLVEWERKEADPEELRRQARELSDLADAMEEPPRREEPQ